MFDVSTALVTFGTAIGIPAANFALFQYPQAFSKKAGALATFQETHIALLKESNNILTNSKGALDVLQRVHTFCSDQDHSQQKKAELLGQVMMEVAKLRGYLGCNELCNGFVAAMADALGTVQTLFESNTALDKQAARNIQIASMAGNGALQIHQGRTAASNKLYKAEMQKRQASIDMLNYTLRIAMVGLTLFLGAIGLWLGYSLHDHGIRWRFAIPEATAVFLLAVFFLRRMADASVKPAQKLIAGLKEINSSTL